MHTSEKTSETRGQARFATTRWTVVLQAQQGSAPEAGQALETLCQTYWYPLYAFVRREGYAPPDAEDLTQAFFARFLQRNFLESVRSDKGRFRSFLLAACKHFLSNERDWAGRQKRGGHATHLSLNWQNAEARYRLEPADNLSPDIVFDKEWALTMLELVLARLRQEFTSDGKADIFEKLKIFLTAGTGAVRQAALAAELGMSEGALKVAVHRLRRRYRELLREEIAQTLSHPEYVEEEIRALFGAFAE